MRCNRLLADDRLCEVPIEIADEAGALLVRRHRSHRRPRRQPGLHPSPQPATRMIYTTTTHKTLRGPRGGLILCDARRTRRRIDSAVFPGGQGGPLHARDRRQGGRVSKRRCSLRVQAITVEQIVSRTRRHCRARLIGATRATKVVAGGTDNHLFLLSLVDRDTTGKAAQIALERAGITANKNMVPFDPRKPMVTSGVRIGTPAVTTRGMCEAEMAEIGSLIVRSLERPGDVDALDAVRVDVEMLCRRFPLYTGRWNDSA